MNLTHPQPLVTGNDIPDDLWRIIAGHIPRTKTHRIQQYMAVNRTFYNYALDTRYGEVRWIALDQYFLTRLTRLRDPLIAQHVRTLYIRAWFIEYLLKRDALLEVPSSITRKTKTAILSSLDGFFAKFRADPSPKMPWQGELPWKRWQGRVKNGPSSQEIIHSLITAVKGMTNVIELNFEWRDLPLNKDTRVFLTSTRTAFATSLRKLVLCAQISKFKELLAITNFDNIDELDFHFDYRTEDATRQNSQAKTMKLAKIGAKATSQPIPIQDPDIQDLLSTIIPFISRRQHALYSLAISSSSSVDLAEFFNALPSDSLSRLRRFTIQISFDEKALSDPSGILRFLKARAALLTHVSFLHLSSGRQQVNVVGKDWKRINDILLSKYVYLSSLESLELPYVSVNKTIPLLQRSNDTLKRLCLTGHYLTSHEAAAVVSVFNHRPFGLLHLHLEVAMLDLPLIQMLATRLPGLLSLVLVFELYTDFAVVGAHGAVLLSDWKLCELGVYTKRYRPPTPEGTCMSGVAESMESEAARTITAVVPSIRVLKGIQIR